MRLRTKMTASNCYCGQCKRELFSSDYVDVSLAWCHNCESVVKTSALAIPIWTLGTTVLLFTHLFLIQLR